MLVRVVQLGMLWLPFAETPCASGTASSNASAGSAFLTPTIIVSTGEVGKTGSTA